MYRIPSRIVSKLAETSLDRQALRLPAIFHGVIDLFDSEELAGSLEGFDNPCNRRPQPKEREENG